MKTWEMIKELTENPGQKFKRVGGELEISVDIDDNLNWKSGYSPLNIYEEWEEVKQPVSFMEAVESGKRIKLEHEDDGEKYVTLDYFLASISGRFMQRELRDLLLRGTFYIKS